MIADALSINRQTPPQELAPAYPQCPSLDAIKSFMGQLDLTPQGRQQHDNFYSFTMNGQSVIVLTHPDYAQHVFQRPHIYPKAFPGYVSPADDRWRLGQLRLLRPQFHRRRLASLCDLMVTTIDAELHEWSVLDSFPLDLLEAMRKLTLNVLTHAMFGPDLSAAEYTQLAHTLLELLELVEDRPGAESALFSRTNPALHPALAIYDDLFGVALARCRQSATHGHNQGSLLAMLLDTVDARSGQALTEKQLREEILLNSFAGFENIAIALAKSFHLLMAHPTVLAKLQAEVDEVLKDELPTLEHLERLIYAGMVLQETLRLHPSEPWLHRQAVANDMIAGHPVPAGAIVMLAVKLYQADPEFWANATAFMPEHFDPARATERQPCAWLPFGAGQRFCLGKDFAFMEGKLILAMTLQRFDFTADE